MLFTLLDINPDANYKFTARLAEEERIRLEADAAEARRKEEEEQRAALLEERRKEREELDKKAALQQKRQEDAEKRRAERNTVAKSQPPSSSSTPWRRQTPQGTTPSTPPRSESPAPAKYRPGAFSAARTQQQQAPPPERTSSPAPARSEDTWQRKGPLKPEDPAQKWKSKAAEERKGEGDLPNPSTPQADTDGFQTVEKRGVWRPSRGRGGPKP